MKSDNGSHRQNQKLAAIKLINLVQEYPFLYDKSHTLYRNKVKTDEAWNCIAKKLGETGEFLVIFRTFLLILIAF